MTFNVDNYKELVQKYAGYMQSIQDFDKFRFSVEGRKQLGLDSALASEIAFEKAPDELVYQNLEQVISDFSKRFEAETRSNLDTIVSDAHDALTADGLLGYLIGANISPAKGKYDDVVAKHQKLTKYRQMVETAKETKDNKQVAAYYMEKHKGNEAILNLIAYHARHSGNLLVEIFEQKVLISAGQEFVSYFADKEGTTLDSDKLKDYSAYAFGSVKGGKSFSDATLNLAIQTYLTKKK
nr:hypothetical protein [Nanoarchaeum sp.]